MSDHLFCQYSKRWRYLQAERRIRFSAEKPRRLRHATGMSLRAAFRILYSPPLNNKPDLSVWFVCLKRVKRSTGVGKTEKKVNFFLCCLLDKLEFGELIILFLPKHTHWFLTLPQTRI
jgi:hypothetical protein